MSSETEELKNKEDGPIATTPIPVIQVICVCMVQMSEALNVELLFPFLAFMVEDMGYTGEALGYHAGILAASFCGAQFCTSVAWGVISDRYGRKAAIVAGTLGSGLGMLIFGLAKTFQQAILGRIVGGLLCGNLGVVKSFLTEITDDTNRSPSFYWLSLSWAVGSVFAPLLGGMLSKPAEKYPNVFSSSPDSLFVEFPYLLPCLFSVGVTVVASLLCWIFMIETVGASKEEIQARIAGESTEYGQSQSTTDSGEHGLQMVPVGSSSTTGDGEVSKKDASYTSNEGYSRLPFDTSEMEYEEDVREGQQKYRGDNDADHGTPRTDEDSEDDNNRFETVFDDQNADSLSSAGYDTPTAAAAAASTEGMSTAMLQSQGRVRNRSRSSSTTMPYPTAADVESGSTNVPAGSTALSQQTQYQHDRVWNRSRSSSTTVPYTAEGGHSNMPQSYAQSWARNRSRSSSNTASFIDLEQPPYSLDHTGIAFRPRGGSTTSQFEVHNDVYSPTGAYPAIAEEGVANNDHIGRDEEERGYQGDEVGTEKAVGTGSAEEDETEEICCPGVFECAAHVGRYLNCMSRTTTASALDGSVHSSQQLLGDSTKVNSGSVLVQRVVVLATLNYGMVSACSILIDETLPLYLKLESEHGGFGFNSSQIGLLLSTGAAGMMLLTVLCMPLTMGVSNKWISFQSLAWSIPVELAFPLIALLNNEVLCDIHSRTERVWLLWPLLMIVNIVKNYFCCLSLTSAIMMVNHSVTDEYLGAVNGLGQTLGALARCLGPAVGGLLWSMGTRYNFVWLNFIFITLLYLLNMYVSDLVPKSLDYKKQRRISKQR